MTAAIHVPYTSDSGTVYQRRTLADIAAALGLAGEAVGAHPYLPRHIRPRYVLARDPASGREHKIRGMPSNNTAYTGAANTIDVPNPDNRTETLTLNVAGRMGERRFQP